MVPLPGEPLVLEAMRGIFVGVADEPGDLREEADATGRTEGDPIMIGRLDFELLSVAPLTVDSEWLDETDARELREASTRDFAFRM